MKKRTGKQIRYARLAGVLFIFVVLAFVVYGSFAAYTSFNSVKRVVSTGNQSDTMFSSNYLSLLNQDDTSYPTKRISLAEKDGTCTFTVQICNYVWGDETFYNPKNITYNLTAQLIAADGGDLPAGIDKIRIQDRNFEKDGSCRLGEQTLQFGSAKKLEYTVVFPSDLKDKVKMEIKAEPDGDSKEAVNNQKLAAILSFADYKAVKSWTGHFLDFRDNTPDQYDAFNYEISGNGSGTVTVTLPDSLLMSAWAGSVKQESKSNSYSFQVDSSSATVVQFQLYRNPSVPLNEKNWEEMEKLVTVSFTEKVDENDSTQE